MALVCEGGPRGGWDAERLDKTRQDKTGQGKGWEGYRLLGGWQHLTDAHLRLASSEPNTWGCWTANRRIDQRRTSTESA